MGISRVIGSTRLRNLAAINILAFNSTPSGNKSWDHHTEFAVGLDWSVLREGLIASAGWDQSVAVWHMSEMMAV
eukprot:1160836-Pelagomonas_calceolata.AAC.6